MQPARRRGGLGEHVGQRFDAAYIIQYLQNPAQFGNNVMSSYAYLGEENRAALGAFLSASRGGG